MHSAAGAAAGNADESSSNNQLPRPAVVHNEHGQVVEELQEEEDGEVEALLDDIEDDADMDSDGSSMV